MARKLICVMMVCTLWLVTVLPCHANSNGAPVFGPKRFDRTSGGPKTETMTFSSPQTGEDFLMRVESGQEEGVHEPASGTVTLNAQNILGPSDFKQEESYIERRVSLGSLNELVVRLTSTPGTFLVIRIFGKENEVPDVTFSVSPKEIEAGRSATLSWTSIGAVSCSIDQGIGDVPLNGSIRVSPMQTATYTITATAAGGSVSKSATVAVTFPEPSVSFSVSPETVVAGQPATLTWNVTHADGCIIEPGIGVVPLLGSIELSPRSSTVYTITATGPGGTASASTSVRVTDQPPATPSGLSAMSGDEQVYLSWDASGESDLVGYHVYRSEGAEQPFVRVTGVPLAINELFDGSLTNGIAYNYAVTAVSATGAESEYSSQVSATPFETPVIKITSPPEGSTVEAGTVCVTGMVSRDMVGVMVNGVAANVRGRRFIAYSVPMATGANIITAVATEGRSGVGSDTVAVTSSGESESVVLNVTPTLGIPPISASLDLRISLLNPVAQIEWDLDGDGWPETVSGAAVQHTYTQARIYRPAVLVSDVKHIKYAGVSRIDAYLDPVVLGTFDPGSPVDVETDESGNLYVLDASTGQVRVHDAGGVFIRSFGSPGTGEGQMLDPRGLAVDTGGNVYVADTGNCRVQVFDNAGSFRYGFGRPGSGDGQFTRPEGVAVSPGGDIYVSDTGNHRVQVFGTGGRFKFLWGIPGIGVGQFNNPKGIVVTPGNDVYVADSGNDRIQHFSGIGSFKKALTGLRSPSDVSVSGGFVHVADTGNGRVTKYGLNAQTPCQTAATGLGAPQALVAGSRLDRETVFVVDDGAIKEVEFRIDYPDPVWNRMKQALIGGNIEEAMGFHREESRATYRAIYENLGGDLAREVQAMQPIELIYVRGNQAKYRIKRMQEMNGRMREITYYVYFVRDENNVWHIDRY